MATIYPVLIYVGTVYQGEHYVVDVLAGVGLAVFAYIVTPHALAVPQKTAALVPLTVRRKLASVTKMQL